MAATDTIFAGAIPELYERLLGPVIFEPFAQDMARRFEGFEGRLLETAAGTGRVTRALAAVVGPSAAITATDLNAPMLAQAQALMAPGASIAWREADALALPFADDTFEAVVCQFGVMFFPDKLAGYREALRVLAPQGRFVFNVWDRLAANDLSLAVHEAVAALFPDDPPDFLAHTPFGYNDPRAIRSAVLDAGFADADIAVVRRDTPARSAYDFAQGLCLGSPLRSQIEARRPGGLEAVSQAVGARLTEQFGAGAITGRGQALVVTATA